MASSKSVEAREPREGESPEDVARECIARAERQRATELILADLGLTELPPEIGQLTSLTTVHVWENELTALPPEIGRLTSLTGLCLRRNDLMALPPEIGRLTSLTTLDVSRSKLTALPPEIGELTALTMLDVSENELTKVPPEIGRLTSLTTLDVYGNKLTALPPEIGELTALTMLDVSENELTKVPPEIGRLSNLTHLDLSANQLAALPPKLRDLTALRELSLYGNDALGVPAEVLGRKWWEFHRPKQRTAARPGDILDYYFRRQAEAAVRRVAPVKPSPNPIEYRDLATGTTDDRLTPGGIGQLTGHRLKFHADQPDEGIFFIPISTAAPETRATILQKNQPSQLVFLVPPGLPPATYSLEVRARIRGPTDLYIGRLDRELTVEAPP